MAKKYVYLFSEGNASINCHNGYIIDTFAGIIKYKFAGGEKIHNFLTFGVSEPDPVFRDSAGDWRPEDTEGPDVSRCVYPDFRS